MRKFSGLFVAGALGLASVAGAALADVGPNPKLDADGMTFANVSISVADMDKSTKFYQALGFEIGDSHDVPAPVAKALGSKAKDAKLEIRFVKRDGIVLELIHLTPTPKKAASGGSAEQLGLCHIAFRVDDVDRVAKLVKDNGGKTIDALRTKLGPMDILFATDPDGTHIEIAGPAKS
jgi:catechol 2,3-dioxygenase-like lactoylglutathione lyase family enzyme